MAFDGLVTRAVANELSDKLTFGKIDKIYQPDKNELVIFVHTKNGKYKLFVSADTNHAGIYISDEEYQNPLNPPALCMLLRKHLIGGRITEISQKSWERIIEIVFETRDELGFSANKKLIVEIMGKHSNIVLVDMKTSKIIDAVKRISIDINRARQILPGIIYQYPPSQNKIPLERAVKASFHNMTDSRDILNTIEGIAPVTSRELFASENPAQTISTWLTALKERKNDCRVYFKDGNMPFDFHVLPLKEYAGLSSIVLDSVSAAVQYYYSHRETSNRIKQKSSDLSKHTSHMLKKLYLKKQRLSEDILAAQNSEKYRLYGELLTANIHLVKPGAESVKLLNYYTGENINIPLDKRYHPSKNAQNYFKKYSKAKTAVIEKKRQLTTTDTDIKYLESVMTFIDSSDSLSSIESIRSELIETGFLKRKKLSQKDNRKKSDINPYTYKTSDGLTVMAGRNNKENDALTMKKASKNDIWFHTKDIPGSHTLLFTEGKEVSDNDIFEAAAIAAYHSKAHASENVPVDYTKVRFVKKPNGAKPGMVIFTDNKTVYVTPKLP